MIIANESGSVCSHERTDSDLACAFQHVRRTSEKLVEPLSAEDCVVQTMPDVSPTKWHLAHTTWFFETLVLSRWLSDYVAFHPQYRYLFNSYYNSIGEQFPRPCRGQLTRPTLDEIMQYRRHVDDHMARLFESDRAAQSAWRDLVEIGMHHEQQHQELILTDIKHVLWCNPLEPAYRERDADFDRDAHALRWQPFEGGLHEIGFTGDSFSYDNERPRHTVYLNPFQIASRPTTNGEFLEFMRDGGYRRSELWLSAGWDMVQTEGWTAPQYWSERDGEWHTMTLAGGRRVVESEPVCHLSYFEADAFARWSDAILPTEAMWEVVAQALPVEGNFAESNRFHPAPAPADKNATAQVFGDVWEWTSSPYTAYPGFQPALGALGEYNGKFMCNQMVLRGGSCVSPRRHLRVTYRNFFPPDARWQFSGLRLARWEP